MTYFCLLVSHLFCSPSLTALCQSISLSYLFIQLSKTAESFKERYAVHKQSFKDGKTNQTSLSKYITKLKNEKIEYDLKWKIIDRGKTYSPVTNTCHLCIKEAYHIIFNPQLADLNSKSELFASCRHKKGELLCNKS